jgi:hypothetical protein
MGGPYAPLPPRPQLRVRAKPGGPHVDLGISYSELIVGILDTLDRICTDDAPMDQALRTALDAINVHRRGK